VAEAVQVAWDLITNIPPQIATCEPMYLDDNLHELIGGTQHPPEDAKYGLIYSRPILYTSCLKKDINPGRVRVVRSDDATDSVSKKGSDSNSSGAKIQGGKGEYQFFVFCTLAVGIACVVNYQPTYKLTLY